MDKINQDKNLTKEYESIVKEINESDSNYINKVLNNNTEYGNDEKDLSIDGKSIKSICLFFLVHSFP